MADYPSFADYDPSTAVSLFEESAWEKSFASEPNGGSCVEARRRAGQIEVRNSKRPEDSTVLFTIEEWDSFLDGAKKGEFDQLLAS